MKVWIWIIVVALVVVGLYFIFSSDDDSDDYAGLDNGLIDGDVDVGNIDVPANPSTNDVVGAVDQGLVADDSETEIGNLAEGI